MLRRTVSHWWAAHCLPRVGRNGSGGWVLRGRSAAPTWYLETTARRTRIAPPTRIFRTSPELRCAAKPVGRQQAPFGAAVLESRAYRLGIRGDPLSMASAHLRTPANARRSAAVRLGGCLRASSRRRLREEIESAHRNPLAVGSRCLTEAGERPSRRAASTRGRKKSQPTRPAVRRAEQRLPLTSPCTGSRKRVLPPITAAAAARPSGRLAGVQATNSGVH